MEVIKGIDLVPKGLIFTTVVFEHSAISLIFYLLIKKRQYPTGVQKFTRIVAIEPILGSKPGLPD